MHVFFIVENDWKVQLREKQNKLMHDADWHSLVIEEWQGFC